MRVCWLPPRVGDTVGSGVCRGLIRPKINLVGSLNPTHVPSIPPCRSGRRFPSASLPTPDHDTMLLRSFWVLMSISPG